jgi:hypothetical protein
MESLEAVYKLLLSGETASASTPATCCIRYERLLMRLSSQYTRQQRAAEPGTATLAHGNACLSCIPLTWSAVVCLNITVSLLSFFGLFEPLLAAELYISEGIQHYTSPISSYKRIHCISDI